MRKLVVFVVSLAAVSAAACGSGQDLIEIPVPVHHNILVTVGDEDGEKFMYLCETQARTKLRPTLAAVRVGKVNGDAATELVRFSAPDHYLQAGPCPRIPVE